MLKNQKTDYQGQGVDYFRVVAAVLVIAIHTGPLASFSQEADFVLTGIIARIAVPFFIMASGFFLFSPKNLAVQNRTSLKKFLKKTGMYYGASIFMYLPVNFYTGAYKEWGSVTGIIKVLLFDATLYHLWYLPAVMIGAIITWMLLSRWRVKKALLLAGFLYTLGLLGDSYYGIMADLPLLAHLYDTMFLLFEYTRNGIFYTPLFFLLGALAAQKTDIKLQFNSWMCMVCLAAMVIEGICLHKFELQRHDSMYVMLPFCLWYLFQCLLCWQGKSIPSIRRITLTVYLIHPGIIIGVRGIAKITGLKAFLVDNSVLFFLTVAALSFAVSILLDYIYRRFKPLRAKDGKRAWVEINLANLKHNAQEFGKYLPSRCNLMAVVKADAYGHGLIAVSKSLQQAGTGAFATATIEEAVKLRKAGITGEILVLGYTPPELAGKLARYHITQTIVDKSHAAQLSGMKKSIKVHVKVDTGMHRLGEAADHMEEIAQIFSLPSIRVTGIFTHLSCADSLREEDTVFTKNQVILFENVLKGLKERGILVPKTHVFSSYGVLNGHENTYDYARIGIALYGVLSAPGSIAAPLDLKPVLSLKSKVVSKKRIKKGQHIGYGHHCVAEREMTVAVASIGYADGLPRSLSLNNGCALIRDQIIPIIGRVCMDQVLLDVTALADIQNGDTVTFIGRDEMESLPVESVAQSAGTIANEVLSRLGSRLERVYIEPHAG